MQNKSFKPLAPILILCSMSIAPSSYAISRSKFIGAAKIIDGPRWLLHGYLLLVTMQNI
jgi:hypothetical protein